MRRYLGRCRMLKIYNPNDKHGEMRACFTEPCLNVLFSSYNIAPQDNTVPCQVPKILITNKYADTSHLDRTLNPALIPIDSLIVHEHLRDLPS